MSEPIDLKMVERLARAMDPALWSDDTETSHMAASPLQVCYARERSVARAEMVMVELAALQPAAESVGYLRTYPDGTYYFSYGSMGNDGEWTETPLYAGPVKTYADGVEDAAALADEWCYSLDCGTEKGIIECDDLAAAIRALKGE